MHLSLFWCNFWSYTLNYIQYYVTFSGVLYVTNQAPSTWFLFYENKSPKKSSGFPETTMSIPWKDQLLSSTLPSPVADILNTTGEVTKELHLMSISQIPNNEIFSSNLIDVAIDNDGNLTITVSSSDNNSPSTPQKSVLLGVDWVCAQR